MSSKALFRLAAVTLSIAGLSLPLGMILHPSPPYAASVATPAWAAAHLLWWLGALAAIPGLMGVYLWQREQVGVSGFIGVSLAVVGLALIASAMHFEAFIAPSLASGGPDLFQSYPSGGGWEGFLAGVLASGALFGAGFLLFGIALFRAGTLPRWAIVVAVVGGIPFAVNFLLPRPVAIVAACTLGAGLLGLAYALGKGTEQPAARRATAGGVSPATA